MRQDSAPRRPNAAADDVPGDISTGESVEVGGSRLGTVDSAGDQDFYAATLVAGVRYTFTAGWAPGSGFPDFRLLLFDSNGALLKANDNANWWTPDAAVHFTAPDDGTYFLGVRGKGAGTGAFRVLADADDHGDGIEAATRCRCSTSAAARWGRPRTSMPSSCGPTASAWGLTPRRPSSK